jgi:signal transduction histidine kinase
MPIVKADSLRLRQVLINLLNNAVKFTERGHVVLTASLLETHADLVRIRFAGSDTGIGIAQENHARVFDSFSQEDGSTARRFGGTGLGLAICKELVALLGGELELRSERGSGTTFEFAIDLEPVPSARQPRPID